MLSRLSSRFTRTGKDERGGDMVWTMLFIIPFMLILTFLMVDLGTMFATRFAVTNVLRDSVRQVSAYGSNCGGGSASPDCRFAPPPANRGVSFSMQAEQRLNGANGNCNYGPCYVEGMPIRVTCGATDGNGNIRANSAALYVGDEIGCEIAGPMIKNGRPVYPYKGVTGGILNTSLAAGFGGLVGPFPVKVLGRSEAGDNPSIK